MSTLQVPTLDLSHFTSGSAKEKAAFTDQLGNAFLTFGFAKIRGHEIPSDLISEYYELSHSFFQLSTEKKRKYEIPELAGQRGYTSFGREHAKGSTAPDLKEFFQLGQEYPKKDADPDIFHPNIFVKDTPGFTEKGIELYQKFEHTASNLLMAIAQFLDLDEQYFSPKVAHGNSILRAIYYPPITSEPETSIRAESHEDINLITLLVGASAGGLQLLTKENEWLDIQPENDEIVVNVGDMLQRLTNNYLPSTTHRVINPPRERWHEPRLSIPFFLHPVPDMDLTCLGSCVSEDNPAIYEPITAYDYLIERLRDIGLKK